MIKLTRLNGSNFTINSDYIEILEETPDTIITMTNGKKYVAKEKVEEIIQAVVDYRAKIIAKSRMYNIEKL